MDAAPLKPLGYHAMRLRWCGLALVAFLRRWAAYFAVAGAVAGAGAVGYQEIIPAVAAWLVLPLFYAAARSAPLGLAAAGLQALAGAALVWGLRALLWPARWGDAERALPIAPAASRASDAVVVAIGLAPLGLLYAIGAATLLGHDPAWLHPHRLRAVAALAAAATASVAAGVALLQALRRPPAGLLRARPHAAAPVAVAARAGRARWPAVLLWLPLWRGPARRTGWAWAASLPVLGSPAVATALWPAATPWWLAAFALLALVAVTRIDTLARQELAPLFDACAPLPLDPAGLPRGRAALALLPLLPGGAALAAALPQAGLRPAVFAAYALACAGACVMEVRATPAGPGEPGEKAGRWLFTLILCICLATEVCA